MAASARAAASPSAGAPARTAAANSSPAGLPEPARSASSAAAVNTAATLAPLAPVPSRPLAAVEHVAAAVQLQLGQRAAQLQPRRFRRAGEHGGGDQRHGEPVGRQHTCGAGRLHQLVEVRGSAEPEQRDQNLGVQRSAERAGQQQPGDVRPEAVHDVPELDEQLGRRTGGRGGANALGAGRRAERDEQPVDQPREARSAVEHVVHELGGGALAEHQRGAGGHPGAVERVEHHRRPGRRQRGAERGGARGARPRPVRDDEMAACSAWRDR